jgi:hypothetical protein
VALRLVWTRISFQLPFLIPVDDSVYDVRLRKSPGKIRTERVQRRQIGLLQIQSNQSADLRYDTRGTFSFTKIAVDLMGRLDTQDRRKDEFFESERFTVLEKAIEYVNKFIDCVRETTNDFSLARLAYTDVFSVDFSYIQNGENPVGKLMTTGTGSMTITQGKIQYLNDPQMKKLAELLSAEADSNLRASFLMDSKASLLAEDYYLATVLGAVALEIAVSEFMRARARRAGVNDKDLEEMIKNVGLSGALGVISLFLRTDEPKPDDSLVSDCRGAITVRNDVVHRGLRLVPRSETVKRIRAIEKMMTYFSSLNSSG